MNREQLDKINGLLNRIAEMEKVLAIKSSKIRISEFVEVLHRQVNFTPDCKPHEVIIDRELLESAFGIYIARLRAELKDLGYED
jgi:hypothetical protein